MNIDYSQPGKVRLSMVYLIGKIIDEIPEDMKGKSETPAIKHLFYITEYATKLPRTDI